MNLLLKAGSATLPEGQVPGANWKAQVEVGGSGGSGNDGGSVRVDNNGGITTHGVFARGVFAQSIGGGGGSGGDGIKGTGTDADAPWALAGLAFESAGGAPGNTLTQKAASKLLGQLRDWSFIVGGNAGASGDAGAVAVDNTAAITTFGYGSTAIMAQSVGGGGGEAQGFAAAENAGGRAEAGATGKLAIGGAGGAAGDGGSVDVTNNALLATLGDTAHGIFAQSVGGGGGVAGNVERALPEGLGPIPPLNIGLGLDFGRDGGSGGDGGRVTVSNTGDIHTVGANAYAIFAQSVGGGGGLAGGIGLLSDLASNEVINFAGSVGGAGSGGAVRVTQVGDLSTQGTAADGIFAQSAGGQGRGGDVDIVLTGDVRAWGADSNGILTQSRGDLGGGDISINIVDGRVQGGSGNGVGVTLLEGRDNRLTNRGDITTLSGVAGAAIVASTGNDTVINHGSITGSVDLGDGSNALRNETGARLTVGATANLNGGELLNAGTIAPGGERNVVTTAVTGDLVQTAGGRYAVDLDMSDYSADLLDISGSGRFGGSAELSLIRPGRMRPGTHRTPIASAAGGMSDDGITLDFRPSAVSQYRLVFDDVNHEDMLIEITTDFAPNNNGRRRLSVNQNTIGRHINAIQNAGGSDAFAPVVDHLAGRPDDAGLAAAYDHLSPGPLLGTETASVNSNLRFNEAMLSCRQREQPHRFVREGQCDWFRVQARTLDREPSTAASGFRENAFEISGGSQRAIGGNWHGGWGLSYERSGLDFDADLGESDGDRFQAGLMLKGNFGTTTFASGLSLGYGSYETDRNTGLPAPDSVANSSQDVTFLALHLRFARVYPKGNWYLRPMIGGGASVTHFSGFQETGAGGANLIVRGHSEIYPSVQPALEIGGELTRPNGTLLRPYVKLGLTHFFDGTVPEITASFEGAPQQIAPFTVQGETDKTFGDVTLGLDMLRAGGSVLRVNYNGQFSDELRGHAVAVKYSVPF
jgi:hypothetical protein